MSSGHIKVNTLTQERKWVPTHRGQRSPQWHCWEDRADAEWIVTRTEPLLSMCACINKRCDRWEWETVTKFDCCYWPLAKLCHPNWLFLRCCCFENGLCSNETSCNCLFLGKVCWSDRGWFTVRDSIKQVIHPIFLRHSWYIVSSSCQDTSFLLF